MFASLALAASPSTFRFSNVHGDDMVLQSAPHQAQVWGFTSFADDAVTVTFQGHEIAAIISVYKDNITWHATLPATRASVSTTYNISAHSASANSMVMLERVLFGDMYVQSLFVNVHRVQSPNYTPHQEYIFFKYTLSVAFGPNRFHYLRSASPV